MEEIITPENVSKEYLKSLLDAAFMETSYDNEGDILVKDRVRCFVLPNLERKDRIQLLTLFGFEPNASELEKLRAVNRINNEYIIVRASLTKNNLMAFTWDLPITGGLPAKTFVQAVKRFCSIPQEAIADCANDVVQ